MSHRKVVRTGPVNFNIQCSHYTPPFPPTIYFQRFLSEQQLSFKVRQVLFHTQQTNKTFLLEPRMQGQTANEAWWNKFSAENDGIITRIATVVDELWDFRSDIFSSGSVDSS